MNKKSKIILFVAFSILFSALTACAVSYWSQGDFWIGWRGAFLLCLPFSLLMILAWNWAGHGKMLAVMIFCAFALRLGGGLAVQNLLPLYGHPGERREELGFLFDDAWRRDEESWAIAEKEEISFPETLTREYHNDQYGGMVAMGVWRRGGRCAVMSGMALTNRRPPSTPREELEQVWWNASCSRMNAPIAVLSL